MRLSLCSACLTAWTEQQEKTEETPTLLCDVHFMGIHVKHTAVLLPEDAVFYKQTHKTLHVLTSQINASPNGVR